MINHIYLLIILIVITLIVFLFLHHLFLRKTFKLEQFSGINRISHLREFPKTIYIFWDKGWENAPYLCKECLISWKYHNTEWKIIELDDNKLGNYLEEDILRKINEIKSPQHRADIIRVNILNKHGGVWADASIFCNRPLDTWLHEYMKAGVFYFKYDKSSGLQDYKIGNWFIACEKNNYLMEKFCQKFNQRWKYIVRDEYFGFHKVFKELCDTDEIYNNIYNMIPFYDARLPRITMPKFHKVEIDLSHKITSEIETIVSDTNIPMFKFSTKDNCPKNKEDIDGTVFGYILQMPSHQVKQVKNVI